MKLLSIIACTALLGTGAAFARQDGMDQKAKAAEAAAGKATDTAQADVIAQQLPSYPLDTCVVSNEPLTAMGEPVDYVYEGRLVRFCCKGCVKMFRKDPAAALAKIDAAVKEAQRPSYPMKTCPVSGEALGAMGEPLELVHGTRLVRLCCKGCVKKFQSNPAAYMEKIDAALMDAQRPTYPLTTCLVSGEPLEDPVEIIHGTRLVRFCCKKCVGEFRAHPAKYLEKLGDGAKN